jgi:hypothetical protein
VQVTFPGGYGILLIQSLPQRSSLGCYWPCRIIRLFEVELVTYIVSLFKPIVNSNRVPFIYANTLFEDCFRSVVFVTTYNFQQLRKSV